MERVRLRARPDASRDDAVRNRRHSSVHQRRSAVSAAILMKFSYNWLRELVDGLDTAPKDLMRLITLKTAECEGVEEVGAALVGASEATVESVDAMGASHNRRAVVETVCYGRKTVVCGAENCRVGIRTVYVPIGKKSIEGVESDGMLASAAALGITRDHSGSVELD